MARPLHDRVLVKILPSETDSKLIVERLSNRAKVLAIGPEILQQQKDYSVEGQLSVGDTVWLRDNYNKPNVGEVVSSGDDEKVMMIPFTTISYII